MKNKYYEFWNLSSDKPKFPLSEEQVAHSIKRKSICGNIF